MNAASPEPTCQRGMFIVIEGCDRGGKTTQSKLLIDHLTQTKGMPTEYMKFPDRTTAIGKIINEYLTGTASVSDESIHLLFSANRWELKDVIEKKLSEGISLVVDRYAYSGVAYSSAKGMSLDWCKLPDVGLPAADLVIFIDVPIEQGESREGFGEERYEKSEFQRIVRKRFDQLADNSWRFVDGVGSIDEVHQRIKTVVQDALGHFEAQNPPISLIKW